MPTLAQPKNKVMQAATQAALATFAALLLSLLIITHTGCKKTTDNPPTGNNTPTPTPCDTCLPPITTQGAGTFGCKINGKPFIAKGTSRIPSTQLDVSGNNIGIIGRDIITDNNYTSVSFNIDPVFEIDTFSFPNLSLNKSGASCILNNIQHTSFPIHKGLITYLRTDYQRRIFSGTFEFDVYSADGKDTIHITEGRFDVPH